MASPQPPRGTPEPLSATRRAQCRPSIAWTAQQRVFTYRPLAAVRAAAAAAADTGPASPRAGAWRCGGAAHRCADAEQQQQQQQGRHSRNSRNSCPSTQGGACACRALHGARRIASMCGICSNLGCHNKATRLSQQQWQHAVAVAEDTDTATPVRPYRCVYTKVTLPCCCAAVLLCCDPGDKVPADLRLVVCRTATLRAEQSSLTGEPQAVLKGVEPVADANCELQVGAQPPTRAHAVHGAGCGCLGGCRAVVVTAPRHHS